MTLPSLVRLLLLAALWGGSFLFIRMGAPVLGPLLLVGARVGCGALFLLGVALLLGRPLQLRGHGRHYLILGFFNAALPFLLYGMAARTLSASLLSILNATAPIWGALLGALIDRRALAGRTLLGLALGVAGVALLVGGDALVLAPGAGWAVLCGLGAAFSYSLATQYARLAKSSAQPFANAHGSLWAATLLVLPALPLFPAAGVPSVTLMLAVLALGVLCSGVAYLLYFRLVADLGPASALTVTFLIPAFGILWGHLFLGEPLSWQTAVGGALVVAGTALVTGFSLTALRRRPAPCG